MVFKPTLHIPYDTASESHNMDSSLITIIHVHQEIAQYFKKSSTLIVKPRLPPMKQTT